MAKNLDTDDVVERKFDLYRRVWRACGHAGPMPRMFLMRSIHVAPTDAQAHAEARQYLGTGGGRFGGSPIASTRVGWGSNARGMGGESERADNKARGATIAEAARNYEFNIEHGLAIVGSPETVIREIEARRRGSATTCCAPTITWAACRARLVGSSIELFGKEVIPAFA